MINVHAAGIPPVEQPPPQLDALELPVSVPVSPPHPPQPPLEP